MLRTGVVLDPRYQEHTTSRGHPERPERIAALMDLDRERKLMGMTGGVERLSPRPATHAELARVHGAEHIDRVAETAGHGFTHFDADTPVCPRSYEIALLAAGGLLEVVDAVMRGETDNGFAQMRPPGHHAEPDKPMGFCLFNNVAVAARHLTEAHKLGRVLIVDYDVHHGNGTERAFWSDPNVLYVSLHQYPHYPGTGADDDVGAGPGEGRTLNVPLPAECGDAQYLEAFDRLVEPICRQFAPEFVLISAGMDLHYRDPLGDMRVTERGIGAMTRSLMRIARETAGGRVAVALEGGYDLLGLKTSVSEVLDELSGARLDETWRPEPGESPDALRRAIEIQKRYWEL